AAPLWGGIVFPVYVDTELRRRAMARGGLGSRASSLMNTSTRILARFSRMRHRYGSALHPTRCAVAPAAIRQLVECRLKPGDGACWHVGPSVHDAAVRMVMTRPQAGAGMTLAGRRFGSANARDEVPGKLGMATPQRRVHEVFDDNVLYGIGYEKRRELGRARSTREGQLP